MKVKINQAIKHRKESFGGTLFAPFCGAIFLNQREYKVFLKYFNGSKIFIGTTKFEKDLFEKEILVEIQ